MIRRGGATKAAITRELLRVLPALSLGGDLWPCSPLLFLHLLPSFPSPLPAESQGCSEMIGRYSAFFPSLLRLAVESMTADYGTSRSEAAVMRSMGFGLGDKSSGPNSHQLPRYCDANLRGDRDTLELLIAKNSGPSAATTRASCVCE